LDVCYLVWVAPSGERYDESSTMEHRTVSTANWKTLIFRDTSFLTG